MFDRHADDKTEGFGVEHWSITLLFGPYSIFVIAQDYDAGLGTVGGKVLVALEDHDTHGGNGLGNALGKVMKAAVLFEGDLDVSAVSDETILLLRVGTVPGGAVNKFSSRESWVS